MAGQDFSTTALTDETIYDFQKKLAKSSKLLKRETHYSFYYKGLKQELINEGIAKSEWFPSESSNNKNPNQRIIFINSLDDGVLVKERSTRVKKNQRLIHIQHLGKNFSVMDVVPKSIRNKLDKLSQTEYESSMKIENLKEFQKALKSMPKNVNEAKRYFLNDLDESISRIRKITCGMHYGGYSIDESHHKEINRSIDNLLELIRSTNFVYDDLNRGDAEMRLKKRYGINDPKFTEFLSSITSDSQ